MKNFILVILSIMLLSACSNQPTEKEIKAAVKVSLIESNDGVVASKNFFGNLVKNGSKKENLFSNFINLMTDKLIYELVDLKKIGSCIEKDAEYKCEVKITSLKKVILVQSEDKEWLVKDLID